MIKHKGKSYRPTLMMMYISFIIIIALTTLIANENNLLVLIPIQLIIFILAIILGIGVMSYD